MYIFSGKSKNSHRGTNCYKSHRGNSNNYAVQQVLKKKRVILYNIYIIFKRNICNKQLRKSNRIRSPQRHADHKNQWYHKNKGNSQKNQIPSNLSDFLFPCHKNHPSSFFIKSPAPSPFTCITVRIRANKSVTIESADAYPIC